MGFWSKFGHAVSPYYNIIIFVFAIATALVAVMLHQNRQAVDNEIYDWEASSDDLYNVDRVDKIFDSYRKINSNYTLFITLISIFPLLGMLGTVIALLGLDMSTAEAISNAKKQFLRCTYIHSMGNYLRSCVQDNQCEDVCRCGRPYTAPSGSHKETPKERY
jgi:chemotaxis protein MotA